MSSATADVPILFKMDCYAEDNLDGLGLVPDSEIIDVATRYALALNTYPNAMDKVTISAIQR